MAPSDQTKTPSDAARHWVGASWPGTLMELTGMEVLEHTARRTVVSMPVAGNLQNGGILHGGASAALAETAGSFAACAHADDLHPGGGAYAVGTELSASHVAAGRGGRVTAVATAAHLGRTSTVHTVEVRDDDGRLISCARITNRILMRR